MPDRIELPPDLVDYAQVYAERTENGYITWRRGTGGNVELLHIKTREKGRGEGLRLLRLMLKKLKDNPPYDGAGTVFGFCRLSNVDALSWYDRAGFDISQVRGVYAEGVAACFSAPYALLIELHLKDEK